MLFHNEKKTGTMTKRTDPDTIEEREERKKTSIKSCKNGGGKGAEGTMLVELRTLIKKTKGHRKKPSLKKTQKKKRNLKDPN